MSYDDYIRIGAAFADDDAIKLGTATSTSAVEYSSSGDFAGATVGLSLFRTDPACVARLRCVTVTTTGPGTNIFNTTDPIIVAGLDYLGRPVSDRLKLTLIAGGETIDGTIGMAQIIALALPAQLLATGQFKFGLGHVVFDPVCDKWIADTAGTYKVRTAAGIDRDVVATAGQSVEVKISQLRRVNATYGFQAYMNYHQLAAT